MDEIGVDEAADYLREMQMSVSSLSWAGGFTGSAGMSYSSAIADAVQAIEMASTLKANCLIIYPGGRNGHTHRHATRILDSALSELLPVAHECHVRLALEPMLGHESRPWTILDGLQSCLDLVGDWNDPSLGIVLDLYHLGLDRTAARDLHKFIDRVALVQVADRARLSRERNARRLPGCGDVSLNAWMRLLAHAGYQGPIEGEVFGSEVQYYGHEYVLDSLAEFLKDGATVFNSFARVRRLHE
jgi:sugar phosphate isomerase/epimerase